MSETNTKKNNRRYSNKKRNYNSAKKKSSSAASPGQNSGDKAGGNKNRRPKALSPSKVSQKYDNLMEQYLLARKKHYEFYARAKGKQLDKIRRNYEVSLKNLRDFGTKLTDWQKDIFTKKVDGLPADRQYSISRELGPTGDSVSFVGEFEDPHLLTTQKSEDWASDTEESSGTIEDYEKYKASH